MTVKNLLEEGFRVTGFDRSAYVGGLWHFSEDPETLSVLESRSPPSALRDRRINFPTCFLRKMGGEEG